MVNSVLQKTFKLSFLLLPGLLLYSFKTDPDAQQLLSWSNRLLTRVYDPSNEVKLKKWELNLTDGYFLRLRKTYQNGKQEYYSCQLHAFNDLDYIGTTASGLIRITTKADDIIVQTYNDRKGDVDSMATSLTIPVKNMEPEQVDSLRNALLYFKTQRL
ncbi:hypothetical protein HQ865_04195 [Mucilaginibacter mali]|uniref:Uncharacterized protein n=1 Tax=Mucilaginibacter mali TaxID=2740462 RepID=A0A7D4PZL4_9SPHI|nr:hypothetical protein [Mucilaginibacter mali]QKJ28986.1 hypothetical protein HQ865_04195 [Mucilaginibacter mali]